MEAKGEQVNGPMLKEKRHEFEELFNVPEEERLLGDGWLKSFCRAYKLREHRRHGKAASVDITAVAAERVRVPHILSRMPRCFEKKTPDQRGFYCRSNKTAWMTSVLFEE